MSRVLYKYLDIKGGKMMIGMEGALKRPNIQFTNASQLNDPFDCHPNLMDYSEIPEYILNLHGAPLEWYTEKEKNDALNLRNDTWLSSFSKTNDSLLMWSHYCNNHKGICIGMNLVEMRTNMPSVGVGMYLLEPLRLEVEYQDILNRPKAYHSPIDPHFYQLLTKAKAWEYEQEVRLIIEKPHPFLAMLTPEQEKQAKRNEVMDWKEVHHYLPIGGERFKEIYFGINTDPKEKAKIINYARTKLNPDIKLYQMKVDEDAFQLKAEEIKQ